MELLTPCSEVYDEKRKIVVYGFYSFAKEALLFLAMHDIYVYAFLSEKDDPPCREYLGKKVITIKEFDEESEECSLYDLFGGNIQLLKKRGIRAKKLLQCNTGKKVVLYGAGLYGKMCYGILSKCGVNVLAFCDQDKNKIGRQYCNCEVISKDNLKNCADKADIVITLDFYRAKAMENEFKVSFVGKRIFYNNWSKYYLCAGNVLDPFTIFYLRHRCEKITIMGYMDNILEFTKKLNLFDVSIKRAVDHNGYIGKKGVVEFIDKYELVYDQDESMLYGVMENGKDLAGKFIDELGEKRSRFLFDFKKTIGKFDLALDANMGYNKRESIHILEAGNGRGGVKIGILGGSTSDIDLYAETSWTECLRSILEEKDINATIYVGAEQGFSSSQELLKLCRDMILYRPDIVISYSGVNDGPSLMSRKNTFLSKWQEELFEAILQSSLDTEKSKYVEGIKKVFCYGTENSDYCEGWFRNERMMHGICSEYGIVFHAVLQPDLFSRNACSQTEQELQEMVCVMYEEDDVLENIKISNEKRQKISKINPVWMHDFSKVFDAYEGITFFDRVHLFGDANSYLAFRIFELIKEDIENIYNQCERIG